MPVDGATRFKASKRAAMMRRGRSGTDGDVMETESILPPHLKYVLPGQQRPNPPRTHARKFERKSFDVACVQCGYSHSHQQVPFACVEGYV